MITKVFGDDKDSISECANILRNGGIIAFPTETVYGLGACISQEKAVKRIFEVKGRPQDNPLIVHVSSVKQIQDLVSSIPNDFKLLVDAFFPGPLTVLLPKGDNVSDIITAGQPNVAIRMPNNNTALRLIEETGIPLVAPSANISGRPSPTKAEDVMQDLTGKIEGIIDGGECVIGIESTVFGWHNGEPVIFRPGKISAEEITHIIGKEVRYWDEVIPTTLSPGMKYRHYSPDIPVYVVDNDGDFLSIMNDSNGMVQVMTNRRILPSDNASYTLYPLLETTLYSLFRKAEKDKMERIIIYLDEADKNNRGLLNRIKKAETKR